MGSSIKMDLQVGRKHGPYLSVLGYGQIADSVNVVLNICALQNVVNFLTS
jgi:hypothetical protein